MLKEIDNIKKLLETKDITWYKQMVKNAPYGTKLSEKYLDEIVRKTMEEAENVKRDLSMLNITKPIDYINHYNLEVDYASEKKSWGYQYLGMFMHRTKKIVINTVTVNDIKEKIDKLNLPNLNGYLIKDVAMMHEFFHFLEDNYPDSFTKEKHVDTKIFGIFKTKVSLSILREVAAIHFSKIMTNLPHSPIIYQKIYNLKNK